MEIFSEGGVDMKKNLLKMLLGTALVMGLAACGGGDDEGGKDTAQQGMLKRFTLKSAQAVMAEI